MTRMTWQDQCAALAPLQGFDPVAFQGDDRTPQSVCSLSLTLALIYDDCKDLLWWNSFLQVSKPETPFRRTRAWGATAGITGYQFRVMVGLLHELFEVIRDHRSDIAHPFFVSVLQQLPRPARASWDALAAVAKDGAPSTDLGKLLLRLRNGMVFHYEPKAIYSGYVQHFCGPNRRNDRAYISRGSNMDGSRFYFADAAAQSYQRLVYGEDVADIAQQVAQIIADLNVALYHIVDAFIQKRGCAYRDEEEA